MESRGSKIRRAFISAKHHLSPDYLLGRFIEHPKKTVAAAAIALTLFSTSSNDGPITRDVILHANQEATQAHIDEASQLLGKTSKLGLARLSKKGVVSHDCVKWVKDWWIKGLDERKRPEHESLDPESIQWYFEIVPHIIRVNNPACQFHMPIPKALPALRRVAKKYPLKLS